MTLRALKPTMEAPDDCPFVEVLTTEISGEQIGYRYGGSFPGPNAVVAGSAALIEALSDRLQQLPALPLMSGKLYLVETDGIEFLDLRDAESAFAYMCFDEVILAPCTKGFSDWQTAVDQAYWTTLKLCLRLGMIKVGRIYD